MHNFLQVHTFDKFFLHILVPMFLQAKQHASFLKANCHKKLLTMGSFFCINFVLDIDTI